MLVITRIPTHRNDGSRVSRRQRRELLKMVRDAFGRRLGQRAIYFEVREGGEIIDLE